jgi:hypothetical protein
MVIRPPEPVNAFLIVTGALICAVLAQGLLYDQVAPILDKLVPAAVIVAGGVAAGLRLASAPSRGRLLAGLAAPLPMLAIAFVPVAGLSGEPEYTAMLMGIIYGLTVVPLLVAYFGRQRAAGGGDVGET